MVLRSSLALLAVLACACNGAQPQAAAPQAAASPAPGEWQKWSFDQKRAYMESPAFLERERELFRSYDPVRFANIDCKTCHGSGATDGTYRMPNPDLPQWSGGREAFVALKNDHPRTLDFMQKQLGPETARLLGVPAFDMETHTGFSCFHCHTRKI